MKKQNLFGSLLVVCLMASCSSGSSDEIIPSAPEKPAEKLPITLTTQLSRITDNSFDSGDKIGVYVVNYSGGTAGTLKKQRKSCKQHGLYLLRHMESGYAYLLGG